MLHTLYVHTCTFKGVRVIVLYEEPCEVRWGNAMKLKVHTMSGLNVHSAHGARWYLLTASHAHVDVPTGKCDTLDHGLSTQETIVFLLLCQWKWGSVCVRMSVCVCARVWTYTSSSVRFNPCIQSLSSLTSPAEWLSGEVLIWSTLHSNSGKCNIQEVNSRIQ